MTTPATPRVADKCGRLQSERTPLKFVHQYAVTQLPAPVYPVDVCGGIADNDWGMLGNGPDATCTIAPDGVGDCGFAGRQHLRYAKAVAGRRPGRRERYGSSAVLSLRQHSLTPAAHTVTASAATPGGSSIDRACSKTLVIGKFLR